MYTPPPPPPRDDRDFESPVGTAARLASDAVRLAFWPVSQSVTTAGRLERRARGAAGDIAGRAALAVVDAAIASPYTERAVDRVLDSPIAEHAIGLGGERALVEAAARDMATHAVVERVAEEMLRAGVADRLADRILADGSVEQVAARILEGPSSSGSPPGWPRVRAWNGSSPGS